MFALAWPRFAFSTKGSGSNWIRSPCFTILRPPLRLPPPLPEKYVPIILVSKISFLIIVFTFCHERTIMWCYVVGRPKNHFFFFFVVCRFFHPLGAEWEKRQIYSFNVSVWPIHNPTYHHHQHRCRHIGWVLGILFGTVIKRLTFFTILDDTSPAVPFRFFSLRGELQQP